MVALAESPNPYFYMHLPIIQYLLIMILFNLFKEEVLATANVVPFQISPHFWVLIREFEIIYRWVEVILTIGVFRNTPKFD